VGVKDLEPMNDQVSVLGPEEDPHGLAGRQVLDEVGG
jgi:hypothetical protein